MSCCGNTSAVKTNHSALCQSCGEDGKKVDHLAIKSLLKEGKLHDFKPKSQYYYCKTSGCDTVYFTNEENTSFRTKDIKTEIALKNQNREGYVCFCFAHTVKEIEEKVIAKGESHISQNIVAECQLKKDACEVKNPRGKCCLSDVKWVEKEALVRLKKM